MEAATQAIEVEGRCASDIQSYEFRDISLQNALIVPEDDLGVETLFSMRLAAINNVTRHETQFEFLLTSVVTENENDKFVDHCRGTINVDLEPHSKLSPDSVLGEPRSLEFVS